MKDAGKVVSEVLRANEGVWHAPNLVALIQARDEEHDKIRSEQWDVIATKLQATSDERDALGARLSQVTLERNTADMRVLELEKELAGLRREHSLALVALRAYERGR